MDHAADEVIDLLEAAHRVAFIFVHQALGLAGPPRPGAAATRACDAGEPGGRWRWKGGRGGCVWGSGCAMKLKNECLCAVRISVSNSQLISNCPFASSWSF